MEALAAISLAGNIIQFVELGTKVVNRAIELKRSQNGRLREHANLDTEAQDLNKLLLVLRSSRTSNNGADSCSAAVDDGLQRRLDECVAVGEELRTKIMKLGKRNKKNPFKSVTGALKTVWSEAAILKIQQRLSRAREGLSLHFSVEQRAQLQRLLSSQDKIASSLDEVTSTICTNVINGHADALSIHTSLVTAELQRLHSQTENLLSRQFGTIQLDLQQNLASARSDIRSRDTNSQPAKPTLGLQLHESVILESEKFVARDDEILAINHKLENEQARATGKPVILHGLGGIGKTQLALQYAIRYKSSYSSTIWLDASSEASLRNSFLKLSSRISDLTSQPAPSAVKSSEDDMIRFARRWLASAPGRCLWIFDNYDEPQEYEISKYLPVRSDHSVVITSRMNLASLGPTYRIDRLLKTEDGIELLLKRAERDSRDVQGNASLRRLAQRLDGLPLALATAGACLCTSTISFEEYLHMYEEQWDDLQDAADSLPEYNLKAQDRIFFTTWDISFRKINAEEPQTAQLLLFLGYLDYSEVWFELFKKCKRKGPDWFERVRKTRPLFDKAMRYLQSFSLMELNREKKAFTMHPCVHDWLRFKVDNNFEASLYSLMLSMLSNSTTSESTSSSWTDHLRLERHNLRAAKLFPKLRPEEIDTDWVLDDVLEVTRSLDERGHYQIAKGMAARHHEIALSRHGSKSIWTVQSAESLCHFYCADGSYEEALSLQEQVLEMRSQILGPTHQETLRSLGNLGHLYSMAGRVCEAKEVLEKALANTEKLLGKTNHVRIVILRNLARVQLERGKSDRGIQMLEEAVKAAEEGYGPNSPNLCSALNDLGVSYLANGDTAKAEAVHTRALESLRETLGEQHPNTLYSLSRLGLIYFSECRYEEAEQVLLLEIKGREDFMGPENESTLTSIHRLGCIYMHTKKFAEAKEMLQRALQGFERLLGKGNPKALDAASNLAAVEVWQGQIAKAESFLTRALDCGKDTLGWPHPAVKIIAMKLCSLYERQSNRSKIMALRELELKERQKLYGPEDTRTMSFRLRLALMYKKHGQPAKCEGSSRVVFEIYQRLREMHSSKAAEAAYILGTFYKASGRFNEAERILSAALRDDIVSEGSIKLKIQYALADTFQHVGRFEEACTLYNQILDSTENCTASIRRILIKARLGYATIYGHGGSINNACIMLFNIWKHCVRVLGAHDVLTLSVVKAIDALHASLGFYKKVQWANGSFS